MKKMLALCMALALLVALLCPMAAAEISMPACYIDEFDYDGQVLCGHAIVPTEGDYYARVTFVWDTWFVTLAIPITPAGDFLLPIAVPCDGYSVEIVDQYSADVPGEVYAWCYCMLDGTE